METKTLYLKYIMLKKNRLKEGMAALNLFIIIIIYAVSTPLEPPNGIVQIMTPVSLYRLPLLIV